MTPLASLAFSYVFMFSSLNDWTDQMLSGILTRTDFPKNKNQRVKDEIFKPNHLFVKAANDAKEATISEKIIQEKQSSYSYTSTTPNHGLINYPSFKYDD